MVIPRFDAKLAYSLGGVFREKLDVCEKCKCIEFNIVNHPKSKGLLVMECVGCSTVYVTVDRRGLWEDGKVDERTDI